MLEFLHQNWGIIFGLLVSSFLMAVGIGGVIYFWWRIRRSTESAVAEVYKVEEKRDDDGTYHRACARFRLGDNSYEVASVWSGSADHEVGERVKVYYPPLQPEQAMFGRWGNILPFVFFVITSGAAIAALILYAFYWKSPGT
jgi:hypothetical protein